MHVPALVAHAVAVIASDARGAGVTPQLVATIALTT